MHDDEEGNYEYCQTLLHYFGSNDRPRSQRGTNKSLFQFSTTKRATMKHVNRPSAVGDRIAIAIRFVYYFVSSFSHSKFEKCARHYYCEIIAKFLIPRLKTGIKGDYLMLQMIYDIP